MAQIKNTFVKSKMNRDMDARLIPNGEYREGRNINISKSEGSDVGALENVKGNAAVLPGFINKLNEGISENEKPLEIIGMFTHDESSSIYMFLTTFTDASKTQLENKASTFSSHCYITRTKYNGNLKSDPERRFESSILVEGSFLNFSKTHPILGFNIVENLMFWTDNRNQPRKINILKASGSAFQDPSKRYYYKEDQISVAKYYPYKSISLTKKTSSTNFESTVKATTTEWLPVSLTAPLKSIQTSNSFQILSFYNSETVNAAKAVWTGPDSSDNDIGGFIKKVGSTPYPVVRIKNVSNPGSRDYYIYSTFEQQVRVAENPDNPTTQVSVESGWALPGDIIIFQLKNPEFDTNFSGERNFLKDKFPRFGYRFKYDDNEYSLMSPFTQPVFVPAQYGSFTWGDEDRSASSTELNFFENRASEIGLVIDLPYFPGVNPSAGNLKGELQRELHIEEIEILFKSSSDNNIYIIDNVNISSGCPDEYLVKPTASGGDTMRNQFIYKYTCDKPYKVVPESDVTRVNDIVPVRSMSQETSGNRIMYGNYLDNHAMPPDPWYEVSSSPKVGSFSPEYDVTANPPISTSQDNKIKEYYNASLKQGRTYQVGVVFSDRYGRQSTVMLASETNQYGSGLKDKSTVTAPYENTGLTDILGYFGNSLKLDFYKKIPDLDEYSALNYPGLYNVNNNPTGWYSYKIVVKQQQQEYYNVYLPGSMSGNIVYKGDTVALNYADTWNISNLSLFGDNINKIPRDMTNVGPTDRIYGSKESLYFRVVQPNYNFGSSPPLTVNVNRWNSRQTKLPILESTVVSIQPFLDLGKWTTEKGAITSVADNSGGLDYIDSISYPGGYRDSSSNDYIGGSVDPLVKSDNNPFVANIDNNENKDRVGFYVTDQISTSSSNLAEFSKSLIVAETKPKESNLELYWETSTSGLISDLNSEIAFSGAADAPRGLSTWSWRASENNLYDGTTLEKSLLASDLRIITNNGSVNINPNCSITKGNPSSGLNFVTGRVGSTVVDLSDKFDLVENSGSPTSTYNIFLTPTAVNDWYFNGNDNNHWGNMEFVFTLTLSITNNATSVTESVTVVKENNFLSNFAPSMGNLTSPQPNIPNDTDTYDMWAFSIGGEEPDGGQTDYDYVKQNPLFEKDGITNATYSVTTNSKNLTRNRNQLFISQHNPPSGYVTAAPSFPAGSLTNQNGWHNGSYKKIPDGAELYIKKLETAVYQGNGNLRYDFEEWWTLKKLGVTESDVQQGTVSPQPGWFTPNTAVNRSPTTVDLSASAYGSQGLRYTYYDYPWKIQYCKITDSNGQGSIPSSPPWLTGSTGYGNFAPGYYLFADPENPPFEWQGAALEKNNNQFWPEGWINLGDYSVHKITIGVKEKFGDELESVNDLVVYVKLYR